jgi:hypothetical protein
MGMVRLRIKSSVEFSRGCRGAVEQSRGHVGRGSNTRLWNDGIVKHELMRGVLDDPGWNRANLLDVGTDEGLFAEEIQDAGNAAGIMMGGVHGRGFKEGLICRAGNLQALLDVPVSLLAVERSGFTPERNSLAKLAEFGALKLGLEFGLANEDDLEQLPGGSLDVREQTDVF